MQVDCGCSCEGAVREEKRGREEQKEEGGAGAVIRRVSAGGCTGAVKGEGRKRRGQ